MNLSSRLATAALAGAMGLSFVAPRPALADGAASTRNIIFGAAAIGGTLLILNHNKKVHQKYAEYDRHQAETESERNQAQAAYVHEKDAYANQVALTHDLQREIAYQHNAVHQRDKRISELMHSLVVAKYGRERRTAFVQRLSPAQTHRSSAINVPSGPPRKADVAARALATQNVSYGWGSY